MRWYALVAAVAAVVSFAGSFVMWRLSRHYRLAPQIRDRDVHSRPTPRLGGVAMLLGVLVAFAVAWCLPGQFGLAFTDFGQILAILGAATLIAVVGAIDDLIDLDWMIKLAAQFVAAALLAWQGIQVYSLPLPGIVPVTSSLVSALITMFLIVLVMNAVNFIDGLDGLVAGVAIISNAVFFVYTWMLGSGTDAVTSYYNLGGLIAAVLIGVCVGFLPLNWRPAKLFMGDSGALLVGLLMATSTIVLTGNLDPANLQRGQASASGPVLGGSGLIGGWIPMLMPLVVLVVPLLDFALAVIRRVTAGKSPFTADRKHLHHRLLDMGHSHLQAVLLLYAWTTVAAVGLLSALFVSSSLALLGTGIGFVICLGFTLAPLPARRRAAIERRAAQVQAAHEPDVADPAQRFAVSTREREP